VTQRGPHLVIISDLAVAWAPPEDEMVNNDPSSRQRERKRAIRTRIRLTGETYVVAARRHDKEVARMDARRLPVVRCPQCPEGMVDIDETPACRACGVTWHSGRELATEYAEVLAWTGTALSRTAATRRPASAPTVESHLSWRSSQTMSRSGR
jgi:hypothetical protein